MSRIPFQLSQGIWDVLRRLRPHLDVAVDLYDGDLRQLLPDVETTLYSELRALATEGAGNDRVRDRLRNAIRLGQHELLTARGLRVAAFPIWHAGQAVGLLVTAAPMPSVPTDLSMFDAGQDVERLGWALRSILETDLAESGRTLAEQAHTRRLVGVLNLLEQVRVWSPPSTVIETMLQALAIWCDTAVAAYERTAEGQFRRVSALPAGCEAPLWLSPSALAANTSVTQLQTVADLEQHGWPAATGEVSLFPVRVGRDTDFVIAICGALSDALTDVVRVGCRGLADHGERQARAAAEALAIALERALAANDPPGGCAVRLLAIVCRALDARRARLSLRDRTTGEHHAIAEFGSRLLESSTAPAGQASVARIDGALRLPIGVDGTLGRLELWLPASSSVNITGRRLAEVATRLLGLWLAGATAARTLLPGTMSFERRLEQELNRARRFNIDTGLLVVGSPTVGVAFGAESPDIVHALRAELRASDVIGRLAGGETAALLVHTDARGVSAVGDRVARRLAQSDSAAVLGRATFPSAGATAVALLAHARAEMAEAVVRRNGAPRRSHLG